MNTIAISKTKKILKEEKENETFWSWVCRGFLVCRVAVHDWVRSPDMVEDNSRHRRLAVFPRDAHSDIVEKIRADSYCSKPSDLIR